MLSLCVIPYALQGMGVENKLISMTYMKRLKNLPARKISVMIAILGLILTGYGVAQQTPAEAVKASDERLPFTMVCNLTPERLRVSMTGPIQEGVLETKIGSDIRIEFGSDAYTWEPYTDGRNWTSWTGDWDGGYPREYTLDLPSDVGRFNLFLYDGTGGGEVSWFDVAQWNFEGDCWASGGAIDYDLTASIDPTKPRIYCDVNGDTMKIHIQGKIQDGLFNYPPADPLIYLEYGGTDGWDPYFDDSKAKAVWSPGLMSYDLVVPAHVQELNFFLYGRYSGLQRWFDLSEWSVGGDCWSDAGADIRHGDGVVTLAAERRISCELNEGQMIYTIEGPIQDALASDLPEGELLLQYGGTDGWESYDEGAKAMTAWNSETTSYALAAPSYVNDVNFWLYSPTKGERTWFMLDDWTIEGDCTREDGSDIRH